MTGAGTVAVAVIVARGRVLLVQAPARQGKLSWQFPGQAVEPGQSVEEAAIREASQKTGLAFAARKVLGGRVHPQTGDRLLYVACDLVSRTAPGEVRVDGTGVAWSTASELPRYLPGGICPGVQPYLDTVLVV
jgi:8-oxo-dGTP diphosphatase